jgi:protein-S-isoprenylcysteine O-methyltransferase Ste14
VKLDPPSRCPGIQHLTLADRPNRFPWPPVLLVAAIAAALAAQSFYPLPWAPSPIRELFWLFGIVLAGGALLIDVMAILTLQRARTTVLPHKGAQKLVTSGPFAFSRNPIYLANVLLLFGLGLALGNLWFWPLALVLGGLTQHFAILREEAHLQAKFPAGWLAYRRKVRRWI